MRRCKIVTWILILSIVNFALCAPAAVRERFDVSVGGGTATPQKRNDPLDDSSSTSNAAHPHRPSTPQSWNPSNLDTQRTSESGSESVGSSYAPSNPGSPTSPTGDSHLSPLPHPGSLEVHLPSTPVWQVNLDRLSPLSPTGGSPLPPLSRPEPSEGHLPSTPGWSPVTPAWDPLTPPPSPPRPEPSPADEFLDNLLKGKIKRRSYCIGAVKPAQRDPRLINIPT